ncbi:MAG: hypothetical protein ACRBDI_00560 [Alphaproteobacteria bacterium]
MSTNNKATIGAYALSSALLTGVALANADDTNIGTLTTPENSNSLTANLLLFSNETCTTYPGATQKCEDSGVNIHLDTQYKLLTLNIEGQENNTLDDARIFITHTDINKFTIGLNGNNAGINIGQFDKKDPLSEYYNKTPNTTPSVTKVLQESFVKDQIGISIWARHHFNKNWSITTTFTASQHNGDPSPDLLSDENIDKFLGSNGLRSGVYRSFISQTASTISQELSQYDRNGLALESVLQRRFPNLPDFSELAHNAEDTDFKVKDEARDLVILGIVYAFEKKDGKEKILNKIDTDKIASRFNNFVDRLTNRVNDIEIPNALQEDVDKINQYLIYFDRSISSDDLENAENTIRETLSEISGRLDEAPNITGSELRTALSDELDEYHQRLNEEIGSRPEDFEKIVNKNLNNISDIGKMYQTDSNDPSYYLDIQASRITENSEWHFGLYGSKIPSSLSFAKEENRINLYSVGTQKINETFAIGHTFSAGYHDNHLGKEDLESGHLVANLNITTKFNDYISSDLYVGAAAEPTQGAYIVKGMGLNACTSETRFGQLCAHGKYEEQTFKDSFARRYISAIEHDESTNITWGLTYTHDFE